MSLPRKLGCFEGQYAHCFISAAGSREEGFGLDIVPYFTLRAEEQAAMLIYQMFIEDIDVPNCSGSY